jgi:uncharacterized protein (TIGR02452 family)
MLSRRHEVWVENNQMWSGYTAHVPSIKYRASLACLTGKIHNNTNNIERVTIVAKDTIDSALTMYGNDHVSSPLVLNMADIYHPGGCVAAGGGMQEESIFRRTNYHLSLTPEFYPILPDEAVYSREVDVFRSGEEAGFSILSPENRAKMAFIACPGISMPKTCDGEFDQTDELLFSRKVRLILQVAGENGHDGLVLGALGCGAFGCPTEHVARIFYREIRDSTYRFERIEFAILGCNRAIFEKGFKDLT